MFKGGDIQRNIIRLQNLLRQTKYVDIPSSQILSSGTPEIYLPIIHHTLFIFSPLVAKFLSDKNYDMYAKSDLDFINTVFVCLIKLFNYKPLLNTNQFFSHGFAEAKIIFCSDIADIIINKHKELNKNYLPPKPNKNSNNNNSFNNNNNFNISNQSKNNTLNNTFNNTLNNTLNNNNNNSFQNHSFNNNYNNSPERYNNDDKNSLNDSFNKEKDIPPSPKFHSVDDSTEKNDIKNSKKNNNTILESSQEIFSIPIPTPSIQKINQFNQSNQLEIYDSSSDFPLGGKSIFDSSSLNSIKPNFNNSNNFNNNNNINSNVTSINNSIIKNNNQIDFNTLVQVITSLSGSVSQMVNKIEKFKSNVDERLNKMEAEIALIKNRQNIIESQINKNNMNLNNKNNINNNNSNNSINNNFSYNSNNSYGNNNINSESNEQMFSFACDDIKNRHFDNKKNIENILNMNNNIIEEEENNKKNFNTYSYTNTINNMNNNNNTIQTNIGNFTYNNTISNQKYSDTDKLIENVEKKFQETKKLLNQFN